MPVYIWVGIDPSGQETKGELEAKDEQTARLLLSRKKIRIKKLNKKSKDLLENISFFQPKVKTKDIVIFTRQLSTMIDAGLPLIRGLDILANQQENPTLKKMLIQIKTDVESGSTFAEALKRYPKHFDRLYRNMVAAGEIGGILDDVLRRLSDYMEKAQALKAKVKSALTYPVIVLAISAVVLSIILIFVIPTFAKMFSEFGAALPGPTVLVIKMSNFLKSYSFLIFGVLIFLFIVFRKFYATEKGKNIIDKILLKAPVFGSLIKKVAVAKFSRTLGTLINSGVPIIEALNVAAGTAGNKVVENTIRKVKASISEGRSIAQPLMESKVFPPMVEKNSGHKNPNR